MKEQALFFKALGDDSRLRILASLMESPKYIELLAERLDLKASTISFHLKKLMNVGLVSKHKDQYYVIYTINKEILERPLIEWLSGDNEEQEVENRREEAYRQKTIDTFFKFNKLISIPAQQKKRIIVLEKIATEFEKSRIYTEKEVNLIIADFHDDFATLRKYMVSYNIMKREDGYYQLVQE